jgi:hypothetical protein
MCVSRQTTVAWVSGGPQGDDSAGIKDALGAVLALGPPSGRVRNAHGVTAARPEGP